MTESSDSAERGLLRRLPREQVHLDALNMLRMYVETTKASLLDPATVDGFLSDLRTSVQTGLQNSAILYGQSAEAMFGEMVASLGTVQLIKSEDVGQTYTSRNIVIPDYRLVLDDGKRLLVEVKSYFQKKPMDDYVRPAAYLDALARYASLDGCDIAMAVYWVRWNIWTLVPMSAFAGDGRRRRLSMSQAARANNMICLGDVWVGTKPPLTLVVEADPDQPQSDDGSIVKFTISDVYWECSGQRIADAVEASIAAYLAFYGDWDITGQRTKRDGDKLLAIKTDIGPEEGFASTQGFDFVGHLSGMFSKYYRGAISDDSGALKRLSVSTEPGRLGRLIPSGYKGKALPLWRMRQMPSFPAAPNDEPD